jgi:Zn-dependent M28 family amino/carboxypeptidase
VRVPCLGVTQSTGQLLLLAPQDGLHRVSMRVHQQVTMEPTFNVLALAPHGREDRTLVMGAHLDSVAEGPRLYVYMFDFKYLFMSIYVIYLCLGPGLNDNGSGSAMLLELAKLFKTLEVAPVNKVLFAWWAAEEIGLLGSYHFVASLRNQTTSDPPSGLSVVAAVNFDMMASPNGRRQVHNGTQTPAGTSQGVVERSNRITALFGAHFDATQPPTSWVGDDMLGGSDYFSFITANIPAGGLATGASDLKTEAERLSFGGFANAAYDPCYHKPCDTVANINAEFLTDNTAAAASVLWSLAYEPDLMQ